MHNDSIALISNYQMTTVYDAIMPSLSAVTDNTHNGNLITVFCVHFERDYLNFACKHSK